MPEQRKTKKRPAWLEGEESGGSNGGANDGARKNAETNAKAGSPAVGDRIVRTGGKGPLADEVLEQESNTNGAGEDTWGGPEQAASASRKQKARPGSDPGNKPEPATSDGGHIGRRYLDSVGYEGDRPPEEASAAYGTAQDSASEALENGSGKGAGLVGAATQLLDWIRHNKGLALMVLIGVVLAFSAFRMITGGGEESAGTAQTGSADAGANQAAAPEEAEQLGSPGASGEVQESGISFSELTEGDDGSITLESADLSWEGEITEGEGEGETLTLEGPTAAQFERGFDIPGAAISNGTFAVAQEDGPTLHVSVHPVQTDDGREITQGSLYAVEDEELVANGFYLDERQGDSDEVVRTYIPPDGENYQVSYEAPPGTPVPLLIGWRGAESESGEDSEQGPTGGA